MQVYWDIPGGNVGRLAIKLTSPNNTTAIVLPIGSNTGNKRFMANINKFFGESSAGQCAINIIEHNSAPTILFLSSWGVRFYGVAQ